MISTQSKAMQQHGQNISTESRRSFGKEDSKLLKVRNIMGDVVSTLSDEELAVYVTTFQCLVDSWLDEYERQSFDGKTLREAFGEVAV